MTSETDAAAAAGGGGDGKPTPWHSPEQAEFVTNKGWKGGADVVTGYQALETIIGADKAGRTVIMPKDDKDADGIKSFRSKIGVPENAAGYGVPETMKDDPLWPVASELALQAGIPKTAFIGFVEKFMAKVVETRAANEATQKQESAKALEVLRNEWGKDFDGNSELSKRAARQLAAGAKLADTEVTGLLNAIEADPNVRRLFAYIGKSMGEHQFASGDGAGSASAALQTQLDDLRQKRIKGEITQENFMAQADELGRKMEASKAA